MTASMLRGAARELALDILGELATGWPRASEVVARHFRAAPGLPASDRGLVVERCYAWVRLQRRLEAIAAELLPGAQPRTGRKRDALLLGLLELREGVPVADLRPELQRLLGFELRPDRVLAEAAGLGDAAGLEREAIRLSFPTWLLEQLVRELGQEPALAFCAASNRPAAICLRANTLRIPREALIERLASEGVRARPAPLAPDGVVLEAGAAVFDLACFHEGLFEVMDEGSQLVALAVAPPPRGRLLDACAGAGGKTLALAGLLQGRGRVVASDRDGRRLEALRRRASRAGISSVVARAVVDDRLPEEVAVGGFDRVLVDAPCSGLGVLRRHPEARWRLAPEPIARLPEQQLALLERYAPLCAVGGRLVYATCSVLPSENDAVVARFLASQPAFTPVALKEILGRPRALAIGDGDRLRVAPHSHGCDGFFAAVLRRTS